MSMIPLTCWREQPHDPTRKSDNPRQSTHLLDQGRRLEARRKPSFSPQANRITLGFAALYPAYGSAAAAMPRSHAPARHRRHGRAAFLAPQRLLLRTANCPVPRRYCAASGRDQGGAGPCPRCFSARWLHPSRTAPAAWRYPARGAGWSRPRVWSGGHLLGRLASIVAKQILNGGKVVVVRCEDLQISGHFFR